MKHYSLGRVPLHMDFIMQSVSTDEHKIATIGLRAFFRIAGLWQLSDEEQMKLLGEGSRDVFDHWKERPELSNLPRESLERISYILGIYKALQTLIQDTESADAWVKKPNSAEPFNGICALDLMLSDGGLFAVRRYLDSQARGN